MSDYNFGLNLVTLLNSLAILDDHEIDSNQIEVEVVEEDGQEGFATVEIQSLAKDAADTITALQQKLDALESVFGSIKKIQGFDNDYWITSKGLIFSEAFGELRQLKPSQRGKTRNQYLFVRLPKKGKLENLPIHRLVACYFLGGKPFTGAVINHKDGNKLNNQSDNLEWVSVAENTQHAYRNGLAGGIKHGQFKGPVCSEDGHGFGYVIFGGAQADKVGFNQTLVRRCISKPGSKHLGHTFERFNPDVLRSVTHDTADKAG